NATSAGMSLVALDRLPGKAPCTQAVLVRADDSLGQAFEDALPPLYTSGGGHLISVLQITAEPTLDYSDTVAALSASQTTCIFIAAYGKTTVALMEQLLTQQPTFAKSLVWIGGPYLTRDDFLQGSNALPSLPGVVYGVRQNIAPATPEFATFRRMYLDHFGLP